jgi:hypothetical protein
MMLRREGRKEGGKGRVGSLLHEAPHGAQRLQAHAPIHVEVEVVEFELVWIRAGKINHLPTVLIE